jgi:hypothetical protein
LRLSVQKDLFLIPISSPSPVSVLLLSLMSLP